MCGALHFQRHFHHSYNLNKAFVKSNNSIRSPKERTGQAQMDKDTMWALTHQIRKGGRSKKTEICEIDQSQILLPIYSSGRGAGRTQPKHHFNCNLSHSLLAQVLLTCALMPDVPASEQLKSPHQKHHWGCPSREERPSSTACQQALSPLSGDILAWAGPPCWAIPTWPSGEGLGLLGGSRGNLGYCRHTPRKHKHSASAKPQHCCIWMI